MQVMNCVTLLCEGCEQRYQSDISSLVMIADTVFNIFNYHLRLFRYTFSFRCNYVLFTRHKGMTASVVLTVC